MYVFVDSRHCVVGLHFGCLIISVQGMSNLVACLSRRQAIASLTATHSSMTRDRSVIYLPHNGRCVYK